jgi:hypothetical protein
MFPAGPAYLYSSAAGFLSRFLLSWHIPCTSPPRLVLGDADGLVGTVNPIAGSVEESAALELVPLFLLDFLVIR